jgi:hypothetical protein
MWGSGCVAFSLNSNTADDVQLVTMNQMFLNSLITFFTSVVDGHEQ